MANPDQISRMKELLAEVIQKRPDDVIKNERLGDSLTFGPIEPDIRHFHEFCTTFSTLSYGIIPEEQFGAINQMLSDAKDAYINIAEFSPAHATRRPGDEMRALAERFQPAADKFIGATIGYTTYLLYKDGHIQTQIGQINESISKSQARSEDVFAKIESQTKSFDSIIAAAREASASVGVAHFTTDFSGEADRMDKVASKWFWGTIVLSILAVLATIAFFFVSFEEGTGKIIQMVSTKVILLGSLIAASAWCAGIFKSYRHQATVNRFKANALKTFQAFVKATDNPTIRDAVLLETTRAIFNEGTTGLIGKETTADPRTSIMEIVKSVAAGNS